MNKERDESARQCPFSHIAGIGRTNRDWWPNQLRLELLHQHSAKSDPMGGCFDYAREFKTVNLDALRKDIGKVKNTTHGQSRQSGWTAEYRTWAGMMWRCNPASDDQGYYHSRGIAVCERWHSFENFFADMGLRPSPSHSMTESRVGGMTRSRNRIGVTWTMAVKKRREYCTRRSTA